MQCNDIMIERSKVMSAYNCECAGIGRQARLRGVCCTTYGFKSVTRTISSIHKGFEFMNTRFFYLDTALCTEQAGCLLFCYAGSGSVRYSTATPFGCLL